MKIRTGFVSNSSSSSFIIGCNKIPNNVEEMKTLLGKIPDLSYQEYSREKRTSKTIQISEHKMAEQVFNDMSKISLNTTDEEYPEDGTTFDTIVDDSYLNIASYEKDIKKDIIEYTSILFNVKEEELIKKLEGCVTANSHSIGISEYFKTIVRPDIGKSLDLFLFEKREKGLHKGVSWYKATPNLSIELQEFKVTLEKKLKEIEEKYQSLALEELIKSNEFFTVSYADDEGSYMAAFEHGDVFRNTKAATCNMH